MPVYSMTGYASAQQSFVHGPSEQDNRAAAGTALGLEIRSVNSRFLDLSLRLPDQLRHLEPALRELLLGRLKRGKVELRVSLESAAGSPVVDPSPRLLQRLNGVQDNILAWLPHATVLGVGDVLRIAAAEQVSVRDWSAELPALAEKVLADLLSARQREGARLALMLADRLAQLRAQVALALPLVPHLVQQQSRRFLERWHEALALTDGSTPPEAAQERALTEATAFAIRIDVAEEVTRLASHLDEIERLLAKGGEIGKRLDFLIQELHREANTLGSKSAALELTRISVEMKVLIEQMREQVQNIE